MNTTVHTHLHFSLQSGGPPAGTGRAAAMYGRPLNCNNFSGFQFKLQKLSVPSINVSCILNDRGGIYYGPEYSFDITQRFRKNLPVRFFALKNEFGYNYCDALLDTEADMIVSIWEKSGEHNPSIASMVYAMRHVDVGLSMCNISEIECGILRLRELFRGEKLWREFGYYGVLFSVIAESIMADYGPLLEGDGDIPFIDLVEWAYRHQFYQQTLTLIESKTPENLVRSGIFYYCNDEKKAEHITRLFAQQRLSLKPREFFKMDDVNHYFIKIYDRIRVRDISGKDEDPQRAYAALRTQSVENTDPALITGHTVCDNLDTLKDVLFAYYHVIIVRNKISHAETASMAESRLVVSDSDESSALIWMKDSIDYFIESYKKAMAEVQPSSCVLPIHLHRLLFYLQVAISPART
ncbi:MAG: hypothetical protein K6E91_00965 [Butyrivibrio sp.]|nr:hypothetical protein [Butyrivibrio sp.]